MFTLAHEALKKHPKLQSVVIMEHVPRYDLAVLDPTGLKPKLAKFANSIFAQMWNSSIMKDKIVIGKHTLECSMDRMSAWYKDDRSGRYDGVHLYGIEGRRAFTKSMLGAIKSVLSSPPPRSGHPSASTNPDDNLSEEQTQYQWTHEQSKHANRQGDNNMEHSRQAQPRQSVPTQNRFEFFNQGN